MLLAEMERHPCWEFIWPDAVQPHVVLTAGILYLAGILCSAAGIGGGGIYVVVVMMIGQLSPFEAVPISKVVVFSGAFATLVMNIRRQYGDSEVVACIEFNVCRMILPPALIGTFAGVYLYALAPEELILIMLTVLLWFMTALVAKVAWRQRIDELEVAAQLEGGTGTVSSDEERAGERMSLLSRRSSFWVQPSCGGPLVDDPPECKLEANKWPPEKKDLGSPNKLDMQIVPVVVFAVVFCSVMRYHMRACLHELAGEEDFVGACQHPIPQRLVFGRLERIMAGPSSGLAVHMTAVIPSCLCAAAAWKYGVNVYATGRWELTSLLMYQLVGFFTGALGGMVGIGGGLILAPFFLLMGMEPAVSIGTSSTCVFFTSLSTAAQYVLTDRVHMSIAVVYSVSTLLASVTGTNMIHWLQDRFVGSTSVISIVLVLGLGISAIFSLAQGMMTFIFD